ncbi:hypothetical protein BH24ACI3_BH24ACI3_15390 [soil metagenome]
MIHTDIEPVLRAFKSNTGRHERFTSFDYCYNYFRSTDDLKRDLEKSCLVLGYYLASWGMLRGSSFLLQKSAWHFEPAINYIATLDRSVWTIDVDNYTQSNVEQILEIYNAVKKRLVTEGKTHKTLVTKVLLGVFGFMPAFDDYFTKTFREISGERCRFRSVNENSLEVIRDFYEANRLIIDGWSERTFTTDFLTGEKTVTNYPKAKIIDMYGFQRAYAEQIK